VAAEALGDEVLDAVARDGEALALAADLAAVDLALSQLAEVLLEAREAVRAQRRGAVDVAQAPGRGRLGPAQDHPGLELLGPYGEPRARAFGALPQLLPLGELDDRPLHDPIVVHAGPGGPCAAGTGLR
jgi:hypothetical protein